MAERWSDDDPEVAEGDLSEQHRDLVDEADDSDDTAADVPDGVDPADAQEQRQLVGFDEDDYR
ncbi:hypothetical protein E1262_13955 [Jiangella aurantiaca]|uniref:DUF5709 domain-containing protein n=1 Tax=Jiangella aurantiaca TaxID=2530373 RepID=A0A4R5AAF5_9ACTN|nr:hypothetical protein [Jiangella aurantiaca]TDD69121.1 hypothetical protein E1262_13955 [Jiangella aurantiaca]